MCLHRTHTLDDALCLSWSPRYKRSLLPFVAVGLILRADLSFSPFFLSPHPAAPATLTLSLSFFLPLRAKHASTRGEVCHANEKGEKRKGRGGATTPALLISPVRLVFFPS